MKLTHEQIEQILDEIISSKTDEIRNQKIDYLISNIPINQDKIESIKNDIAEVIILATHKLDTPSAVKAILEIASKYR